VIGEQRRTHLEGDISEIKESVFMDLQMFFDLLNEVSFSTNIKISKINKL
jgi:hypothetical protein